MIFSFLLQSAYFLVANNFDNFFFINSQMAPGLDIGLPYGSSVGAHFIKFLLNCLFFSFFPDISQIYLKLTSKLVKYDNILT